jgi:hypothetical protein
MGHCCFTRRMLKGFLVRCLSCCRSLFCCLSPWGACSILLWYLPQGGLAVRRRTLFASSCWRCRPVVAAAAGWTTVRARAVICSGVILRCQRWPRTAPELVLTGLRPDVLQCPSPARSIVITPACCLVICPASCRVLKSTPEILLVHSASLRTAAHVCFDLIASTYILTPGCQ